MLKKPKRKTHTLTKLNTHKLLCLAARDANRYKSSPDRNCPQPALMTGSSEGRQSLYAPNAVTSNRSSSRSTSGGLSRAASSFEQIAPVERSRPRPNPSSQKPRLPPIRQESLNTTQRHSAEDRRSRILDGGRGRRKVLAGGSATAAVADESPRRAIASRFASEAAREGAAAERADAKLRSAVDKAETLLGSERGEDEQVRLHRGACLLSNAEGGEGGRGREEKGKTGREGGAKRG